MCNVCVYREYKAKKWSARYVLDSLSELNGVSFFYYFVQCFRLVYAYMEVHYMEHSHGMQCRDLKTLFGLFSDIAVVSTVSTLKRKCFFFFKERRNIKVKNIFTFFYTTL